MNEREKQIMRLALVYMITNLDDVCDSFAITDEDGDFDSSLGLDFNGEAMDTPTEDEIEQLINQLQ